jgi:hypothetical protein
MASSSYKKVSTHYVVRVVVERVDAFGVVAYGNEVPAVESIDRKVSEVGNAVAKDKLLSAAITKAKGHLDLMGEEEG